MKNPTALTFEMHYNYLFTLQETIKTKGINSN